ACELCVGDKRSGVTYEWNNPKQTKSKTQVIHSSFDQTTMTSLEIDKEVSKRMHSGKDIYILDDEVLKKAKPDLIVAQGLCEVCSPYTKEISRAVAILDNKPEVLILEPKNLEDILQNILDVANKVNKLKDGQNL